MAIDTSLLIAAPMLQDYLVDKTLGTPLAGGIVTMYRDNSRTTFKNWYYQSGSPGAYTYITLDNPLTLSSVGTIQDPNGNDVIPFYYPYDEADPNVAQPYYVTVDSVNQDGTPALRQFTRENFPFVAPQGSPSTAAPTNRNYIINNVFWRNIGAADLENETNIVIAPSQHDGFTMPDIRFVKNVVGAGDDIIFNQFIKSSESQLLQNDVTPEYYINLECSAPLVSGETSKYIQIPISLHVNTLSSQQASVVLHVQNVEGSANPLLDLSIYPFYGTGALIQPPAQLIQQVQANNAWTKIVLPFVFPAYVADASLGPGGDDALFLQIGFPLNKSFNLNIAKPQIYLSAPSDIPDNDFDTYDQVNAVFNSARTGDVRNSLNTFKPFGWVPMDDGTLGNSSSNATTRANIDAWPLFNLIWTAFNPGSGMTSPYIPIYDSTATLPYTPTTFGVSAIADWEANKKIALTRMLGRFMAGTASTMPINISFTTNSTNTITVTSGALTNVYNGMPVTVLTYTGGASNQPITNITYYIKVLSATTFALFFDPGLVNVVPIVTTGTGTLILPDGVMGQFFGLNFGDTSNTYAKSTGYPATVSTGAASVVVRNPSTYMNYFIKL